MTDRAGNLAVIPAKARSTRLPGKNKAVLAGKPLVVRAIEAACDSGMFRTVMVSTDDDDIASWSRDAGAEVPFKRDATLTRDTVEVPAVALDALLWYEQHRERCFEWVCILQPTSPLRRPDDIVGAWHCAQSFPQADAVVSVTRYGHHPAWALGLRNGCLVPQDPDNATTSRQDLPELYHPDGTVLWWRAAALATSLAVYDGKVIPYLTPDHSVLDIDYASDMRYAEWVLQHEQVGARAAAPEVQDPRLK